jgi:hypothetical protein
MADDVKVHVHPVWRDKADFMLNMKIDSEDGALRYEQLWVKRHGEELFEICCIPFFLYDLALGDKVRVAEQDGRRVMEGAVEFSGHHTFRAWFGDSSQATAKDEVLRELERRGCLYEWFSENLLAIDAPNDGVAMAIADYLLAQEEQEYLQYETGRTE